MNEWTVVGVIIALVGLIGAITAPLIKFNSAVTRLSTVVETLDRTITEFSRDNKEEHTEIWQVMDKHDVQLADHDKRLAIIEHKEG